LSLRILGFDAMIEEASEYFGEGNFTTCSYRTGL